MRNNRNLLILLSKFKPMRGLLGALRYGLLLGSFSALVQAQVIPATLPAGSVATTGATTGATTTTGVTVDARGLPTLAPMLNQVTPAVVNISVLMRDPNENNPILRDPFFRRFFGVPDTPPGGQARPQGAGSGVIIDAARGLVLTNHHVIKDAQEIQITLKDRRTLKAQLVGADPGTDIALLRVPADQLTALALGDSEQLAVGDFVVAIGNPFGLGQTVTSGIVSALGRGGLGIEGYEDFIQTDASINPGNSGGALVDLRGRLIGINTAIIGPAGGNVGIGFAVPVNMARQVMEQLLRFGEVRRGRLGVASQDLTPEQARRLSLPSSDGALVTRVERGSPAEQAGLRVNDIVTAINGRAIRGSGDLRNRVGLIPVGEELELNLLRAGNVMRMRLRVGELYKTTALGGEQLPQLAGARVANIEPGMPMHGQIEGVIVTAVEPDSAAHRNGLRSGDILVGVNRRRTRGVVELLAAMRAEATPWRLSLLRGENRLALLLR
jgi:serine protease Do/serine protease DegQ